MDSMTMTIGVNQSKYIFQIEINEYDLAQLSEYKLLGMTFKKSKYQFLNDLSDVLTTQILHLLEKMTDPLPEAPKENE